MLASYIMVGGLTAIVIGLLVWIEIRSRRNTAAQSEQNAVSATVAEAQPRLNSGRHHRR